MEINRKHQMIQNLARMNETPGHQPLIEKIVSQLFENALMQDGVVYDLMSMAPRLNELLEELTKATLEGGEEDYCLVSSGFSVDIRTSFPSLDGRVRGG